MDFNLIIYPLHHMYMDAVLADLKGHDHVFFEQPIRNTFLNKMRYLHTSLSANKLFRLPFQSLWYRTFIPCQYKHNNKFAFLFFQGNPLGFDSHFLHYIRKKYPNSKLCFFWGNMISDAISHYVSFVNNEYDQVYTFDRNDHLRYGWHFHEATFGDVTKWNLPKAEPSDIFFVGKGKDRLQMIHDIYDKFTSHGYKADFHVVNVRPEDKKRKGINYNKPMSYLEVLGHSASTKIILEVVQEGQVGTTLRTSESIIFKKKLLTNNKGITDTFLYSSHVSLFNRVEEINVEEIMNSSFDEDALREKQKQMSSLRLMEKIVKDCDE